MHNVVRARVGRRSAIWMVFMVAAALLSLPAGASAVGRQTRGHHAVQSAAKPFFDSRVAARRAATGQRGAATAQERSARSQLRSRLGRQALVQVDPLTGTARTVQRLDGTLTGPAAGDRADVAMRWARANRVALGLSAADVDALTLPTAR